MLLKRLHAVSCGYIPFFTSDHLPHYAHALLHVYGIPEVILHIPGKRGPKPTPKRLSPADLPYGQVVKRRKGGRVVEVTTQIIFGSEAAVQARLAASTVSQTINTSFVERNNLTCRQQFPLMNCESYVTVAADSSRSVSTTRFRLLQRLAQSAMPGCLVADRLIS